MDRYNCVSRNFTDLNCLNIEQSEDNDFHDWDFSYEDQTRSESCTSSTWTNDEGYDKEVGERVGEMLEAMDSRLYEGTELPVECRNLEPECQIWTEAHPHLRLRGRRIECLNAENEHEFSAADLGMDVAISMTAEEKWTEYELIPGFELQGTKLILNPVCKEISEEHILVEGTYEELLAFDNQDGLWSENGCDLECESVVEKKIKENLILNIWQKVATCLLHNLLCEWQINNNMVEVVPTPSQPVSRYKQSAYHSQNKLPNLNNADLQSLLTISSKTLLNRSTRPPSVQIGTRSNGSSSTVNLRQDPTQRSGTAVLTPFHSAYNRRLAPIDTSHLLLEHLKIKSEDHSSGNLTKHFPALPPIEKRVTVSSPGPITRTFSESKPTERAPLRLNSGSRLPIHMSKINLGSSSSQQLNARVDFPRSANWADRGSSGRILNLDNKTSNHLVIDDINRNRTPSAYRKSGKAETGTFLDASKPKFWI